MSSILPSSSSSHRRASKELSSQRPGRDGDDGNGPNKPKKRRASAAGPPTRTGLACDRCRRRKVRCDNTPGGCIPCRHLRAECVTTDRITNGKRLRGHTEAIEQHNISLMQQLADLHAQLEELGVEPRVPLVHPPNFFPQPDVEGVSERQDEVPSVPGSRRPSGVPYQTPLQHVVKQGQLGRAQETNFFANGYSGNHAVPRQELAAGIGEPLAIFGMQLDLEEFTDKEQHPARSYNKMLGTYNQGGIDETAGYYGELPSYGQCKQLIGYYLMSCNAWQPLLHPPDLWDTVDRLYADSPVTPAEIVIFHVALANIMLQMASRNPGPGADQMHVDSDRHYLYAMSFTSALAASKTLKDIQAIAMIGMHLRTFPDSKPAHTMLSYAIRFAIESGLHRSANSLPEDQRPTDLYTIEIRKRVFWTILMTHVPVCGKLGHPMPISIEDFDIEFPSILNDELQPADPGWADGKCRIFHTVALMKLTAIHLTMWRTVYSVQRPPFYDQLVHDIEIRHRAWRENDWPPLLREDPNQIQDQALQVMALWLKWGSTELEFYLYHPSRILRYTPQQILPQRFVERSIALSTELIRTTIGLWRVKALDTTWGNSMSFLSAIFTLLWCLDKRDKTASSVEQQKLKAEITTCMEVVHDIGVMLGSKQNLRARVEQIVDSALQKVISRDSQRIASAAIANVPKNSPHLVKNEQGVQLPPIQTQSNLERRHSEQTPANNLNEVRPASSAAQPALNTQVAPSPQPFHHHQSPSEEAPYQYDAYQGSTNVYRMDPAYPTNPSFYNSNATPNFYDPVHAGRPNSSNGWQYGGMQTDYAASTLMAMHQGGPHSAQQPSPHSNEMIAYMSAMPNLVPGGADAGGMPDELWPEATWLPPEERRSH